MRGLGTQKNNFVPIPVFFSIADSDSQSDATNSSGEEPPPTKSLPPKPIGRNETEKIGPGIFPPPKHFSGQPKSMPVTSSKTIDSELLLMTSSQESKSLTDPDPSNLFGPATYF